MKKMNYLLGVLIAVTFIPKLRAQEVKFDGDKVLVDGKEAFSFHKKGLEEFSLYKLNTKTEIVFLALNRNGTNSYQEDDYKEIVFSDNDEDIKVNSVTLRFRTWKYIIQLLLEDKVFDLEGNMDEKNLNRFVTKYDEKIPK